jgi:hypothetical protein
METGRADGFELPTPGLGKVSTAQGNRIWNS